MIGQIFTSIAVIVTFVLVIFGNITVRAQDATTFDPNKMSTVMEGSSILGDPAPYLNLRTKLKGGTVVISSFAPGFGAIITVTFLEPRSKTGGIGMFLKIDDAAKLVAYLRKGPEWEKTARENKVFDYSKPMGSVKIAYGAVKEASVVFISNGDQSIFMQIEMGSGETISKFRFNINASLKFANQLQHFIDKANAENPPQDNPKGDAEKDKLFN